MLSWCKSMKVVGTIEVMKKYLDDNCEHKQKYVEAMVCLVVVLSQRSLDESKELFSQTLEMLSVAETILSSKHEMCCGDAMRLKQGNCAILEQWIKTVLERGDGLRT